jgi:hypothetical protein
VPPEPTAHLIIDPHDSAATVALVNSLASLAEGRIACPPTPPTRTNDWVSFDLLAALGKRFDTPGAPNPGSRPAWALVRTWLRAEQIADIFVLRAHRLRQPTWAALRQLASEVPARLWMIAADRPHSHQLAAAARLGIVILKLADFQHLWSTDPARGPAQRKQTSPPIPQLPHAGALAFRAACREQLSSAQFAQMQRFARAVIRSSHALRHKPPITAGSLARLIWLLTAGSESGSDLLVRLRACRSRASTRARCSTSTSAPSSDSTAEHRRPSPSNPPLQTTPEGPIVQRPAQRSTVAEIERQLASAQANTGIDPVAPRSARRALHLHIAAAVRHAAQPRAQDRLTVAKPPRPHRPTSVQGAAPDAQRTLRHRTPGGLQQPRRTPRAQTPDRRRPHLRLRPRRVQATDQLPWSLYLGRTEHHRERLGVYPPSQPGAIRNLTPI